MQTSFKVNQTGALVKFFAYKILILVETQHILKEILDHTAARWALHESTPQFSLFFSQVTFYLFICKGQKFKKIAQRPTTGRCSSFVTSTSSF